MNSVQNPTYLIRTKFFVGLCNRTFLLSLILQAIFGFLSSIFGTNGLNLVLEDIFYHILYIAL